MRHIGLINLVLCLALSSGCHVSFCSKRVSEKNCPTDIRKTHCWCFGEDALFRYPCGPSPEFYGHQATCWREWPTSGSHWRDIHCGPALPPAMVPPETAESAPEAELPNPFSGEATVSDQQPESEQPVFLDDNGPPPQESPGAPENDGRVEPAVPPAAEDVPAQPLPHETTSNADWLVRPNLGMWPELEFLGRPEFAALAQPQPEPVEVAAPEKVQAVTAQPRPDDETRSKLRLIAHDQRPLSPTNGATRNGAEPPRATRPHPAVDQWTAPTRWVVPSKPSLEAETSAALQRFITVETDAAAE